MSKQGTVWTLEISKQKSLKNNRGKVRIDMENVENILVPTAFSEFGEELIIYAAGIAEAFSANMVVASVINQREVDALNNVYSFNMNVDSERYVEETIAFRKEQLARILDENNIPGEKVRSVFLVGNPMDELLKLTVRENVDMIVMGVKGRTNLEYAFVGSVAAKLFRRSPITIVSYRGKKHAEGLRKRIIKHAD